MKIVIPTCCPVCEYKLELVNDQLFCRNTVCPAQTAGKLAHFAKTLKIKGLGPSTIEKLKLEDITELYYLDPQLVSEAIGEKLAVKLLAEIEKSKTSDLASVIASFSIPLIGDTAGRKIATVISHIEELSFEKCKEAGLGDKAAQNLLNWFNTEYLEIAEFLPFSFESNKSQNTESKGIVCITGKLTSYKKKEEAHEALRAAGYSISDNLTKTCNFLVNESNKASSKTDTAEKYGIPIITDISYLLNQ
jgi:DNA ligase (NAD+)